MHTHYLKITGMRNQIPPNIIHLGKNSWKGESKVPANDRMQGNCFIENLFPIFKFGSSLGLCLKAYTTLRNKPKANSININALIILLIKYS